ncbi:MAG TPA: glycosyltransferase family 2 protein [Pyrinomonadaceae bacterium]|jgi:glycosyltransferase involved in cell wall biosynthesis
MLFSFVSTVYNQEKYITSHLESIKFQILKYGEKYEFELVLCDDCSTDKTLEYANRWLDENRHLFKIVKILASETNEGIVRNYIKGLRAFEGDFFHSLGGDDLYSSANLFDCVEHLKDYDIVQGALLEFEDEKIKNGVESQCFIDFKSVNVNSLKQYAHRGKFMFLAPGFFFRKELITEELLNYLSEFNMFEDRPLYYCLLKRNDIKIYYHQIPVVLYRISSASISRNNDHPSNPDLINDNIKFFSILSKEADTLLQKIYLRHCTLVLQASTQRFLYKLNPCTIFDKGNKIFRNIKYRKSLKVYLENLTRLIEENETHILICSGKWFCNNQTNIGLKIEKH